MTRRAPLLSLVLVLIAGAVIAAEPRPAVVPPSPAELLADVAALAAPEMEGRGSGSAGNERAARYIASRLGALGLSPGGEGGTYLQSFPASHSPRLGAAVELTRLGAPPLPLAAGRDWTPHGGSLTGEVTAEVVFVGYGLAGQRGYDEYDGVDVKGKIALALDGAPPHVTGPGASRLEKLIAARARGAAALLIVHDTLPPLAATAVPVRLVSGAVTRETADALLGPGSRGTEALARAMAESRRPASFATGIRARLSVEIGVDERRTANVIGVLPGKDPSRAGQAIVLGAHFDHLGVVMGVAHPGADDNASGTSVLLGLARAFAVAGSPETLVFAFFSGEEMGLLGSAHYARHPAFPLDRTAAMLNFDMVGRLRDGRLQVGGVESGAGLRAIVSAAAAGESLDVAIHDTPFAPSDHASFYAAGTPVLFFYTGEHADYHTPGDTADKIDAAGMATVARLAARIVERLGAVPAPTYVKVTRPARERRFSGAPGSAFLGISPHLGGGEADGLRLGTVLPGTAAARAGLAPGDVIVRLGGDPVNGFDDLRRIIGERSPGDVINVLYLRAGEDHHTSATLDTRP